MSANETRGEVSLVLDGETFVLRPSWEAIKQIETATGEGIVELAQIAFAGRLRSEHAATIVATCVRAWGRSLDDERGRVARNVDTDRVGELIMDSELGLAGTQGVLAVMLALAANGGYTPSGERKAVATKMGTTAAA